jgi:PhnB protein
MSKQPLIEQLDDAITGILKSSDGLRPSVDASLVEFVRIAGDLRDMPSPDFRANLRSRLERNVLINTKTVVFRPGFRTITPYLLPPGPEFVDFLKNVFGAEEMGRTESGPGRFHAELRIGDSMLMVGVGSPMKMPTSLELYVPDVDEVYKRAIDAGCKALQPVEDAHWEPLRFGCFQDPAGNTWSVGTHLGGNYIPEGRSTVSESLVAVGAAQLIDFMKQAFGAKEIKRYEWPGGLYASVQIGSSAVGVSEAANHEWMRPMPSMVYMYVPDCDALYQQALRAGATSFHAPADQSYGDRSGGVSDAWGNIWYMATPMY